MSRLHKIMFPVSMSCTTVLAARAHWKRELVSCFQRRNIATSTGISVLRAKHDIVQPAQLACGWRVPFAVQLARRMLTLILNGLHA